MTKKPKKPRDGAHGFIVIDRDRGGYEIGLWETPNFYNDWDTSTKEIEDLHRWLGDCIRYIKYRQRKK